ncbi:YaaR family protein [Thermococcus sp.]|uniref:YaaR family protein n=1 Tax=Thermococcus sp. TaxID=35749 RepID=UPI00263343D6|nr:YaaR family protein [Thermococcus sp.]
MRINPLGDGDLKSGKVEEKKKASKKKGRRYKSVEEKSFFEVLSDAEAEELEKKIQELVEGIIEAGNELARSPTPRNLEIYKERIKKFLKLVEKKMYRVSGKMDLETSQPKLHVVVEKVNEKLEELAHALFSSERPTLNIAARVGEINGLILNLLK